MEWIGMKVALKALSQTDIYRLEVDDPEASNTHVGESVGYLCPHCRQCDETRHQIWHDEDCRYAGDHGRGHYDRLEPTTSGDHPTPELHPDHEINIVHASESQQDIGIHHGEVLAFRCGCGNLDEDIFEIVHDSRCELADNPTGPMTDHDDVPISPPTKQ